MAFFLLQARYSREAIQAMVRSPNDRGKAVSEFVAAAGGKLHGFFFAFGEYDIVALIEGPDDKTMAACAMAVAATGALDAQATTKLIPMEEALTAMRQAGEIAGSYRSPMG